MTTSSPPRQYYYVLDLVDDQESIAEYERYHQPGNVPPAVIQSMKQAGIQNMKIFRMENRMVLTMTVDDTFSNERKQSIDESSEAVQKWEELMWKFQKPLAFGQGYRPGTKWREMKVIFDLDQHLKP
ncbi:hypothetical protein IE53DRAFT_210503 [Violaceomyces palustris]|uniref:Uncharacterized protein n=1 Tax=Violaceomyces palustris TaxID=1673888 RepID=A0ACD0NQT3_9BASI|nr:hypothetical protein IE53DRAFT_210503 [Violaceomyces palustris]